MEIIGNFRKNGNALAIHFLTFIHQRMSISRNIFRIEKLYADCIDDTGNCFIVYHAELQFFFLRFYYGALIFSNSGDVVSEITTFKKTSVQIPEDEFYFIHKSLGIQAKWKRTADAIIVHLFKDKNNQELIWNCHHPKALTEINYKGSLYRGLGYAETLSLSFKPWNLPIDELSWGRYLSETDTIVWILWKGSYPVNKIFYNNVEYNDALIEDDKIEFGNGAFQLVFTKISIIRKGKLSDVLTKMPWLKVLFKRSILNSVENKYKARSTFSREMKVLSVGWSLYETVIWKN
jgi:hypothetical protein